MAMPRADIVVKLRAQRDFADDWRTTLAEEAADNIERLRSDVAAYKKDFRSIAEALNDPRCDLTHTMAELVAELRAELAACRAILEKIADPVRAMQRELPDGARLNGAMAVALSNDPNYLKGLAKAGLIDAARKGEGE